MKRHVLLFALFCCISSLAEIKATGQAGDRLIVGKDTLEFLDCPIESDSLLRVSVYDRLLKKSFSSGCWRGYIATWRIENKKLYLESIREVPMIKGEKNDVSLEGIFDAYKDEQGRVMASWFSAKTYAATGKMIRYTHDGFERNFEYETMYNIEKGIITEEEHYHNSIKMPSTPKDFSFYNIIISNFNGDLFPELANKRLDLIFLLQPDQNGQIDSMSDFYWSVNGKHVTPFAPDHPYVKELNRCIALVPDWKVSFIRGKIEHIKIRINLWNKKGGRSFTWEEDETDYIYINQKLYKARAFPLQYDTHIFARLLPYLPVNGLQNYTAIWELANERLYLKSIQLWNGPNPFPLEKIFPEARPGEPVEVTWYSGEFWCTQGKTLSYYSTGHYYPTEKLCTFKKGRLTSHKAYQNYLIPMNEQSAKRCHESIRSLNWNLEPGFIGKDIDVSCRTFPNKNGKAEKMEIEITVEGVGKDNTKYTITDPDNPYIKACRKALEQVIWEVQYKRGNIYSTYENFIVQRIKK